MQSMTATELAEPATLPTLARTPQLKIGIDTLFEDPTQPSSAIDYLKNLLEFLPRAGPQHRFFAFVSPRNRCHFQNVQKNVWLVNCSASNENIPLRIAIQQTELPLRSQLIGLDVLFCPGNVCPLWGHFRRVLKINTLHHYSVPALLGRTRTLYRRIAFAKSAYRADHIIANSLSTKHEICTHIGVPDEKVSVVSEASYDFYRRASAEEIQSVLAKYGIGERYILFVSNLYPYKNVDTLIRSFATLQTSVQGWYQLVIAGRDCNGYQAQLENLTAKLNLAGKVLFLGFVDPKDLPALYSGARVFVYPSLVETFGKPLVEAMGCGVPVVASNSSSIPEVLGSAGIFVSPLDVKEMTRAIFTAATNEPVRADLIQKGFARSRKFSWEVSAQETLRVIERTAATLHELPR
jgi:glycosyltransferase involved in cell wall biosynthesis